MRVLVTGTEGYLGSLLAPDLSRRGHDVVGLDTGYYKNGWLYHGTDRSVHTIDLDVRNVDQISWPASMPWCTWPNCRTIRWATSSARSPTRSTTGAPSGLAQAAKTAGVSRFVYMSSCSVYGVASGVVDETSPTNPQTAYADCKTLVERDVSALADDDFSPTFMRNATAFGASPRMRFDIVLNNLRVSHTRQREIAMTSDGTPVATAGPRDGHRQGHPLRARCAARDRPQRGLQCRQQRAELPGPRDRRQRRRCVPRLHDAVR